jgi:hypothetical protein
MLRVARFLAATFVVSSAACIAHTNDVQFLRSQLPALPEGCPVSVLADATPPFAVEDIAVLSVRYTPGGRDRAMHEVSGRTCYYGGDTVYRIEEEPQSNATTILRARIARRAPAAAPAQ